MHGSQCHVMHMRTAGLRRRASCGKNVAGINSTATRIPCRNAFSEVQSLLAAEHPGTEVLPSYYPVPTARKAAVNALSILQYSAMAAVLFADALSELLRTRLDIQVRTDVAPCHDHRCRTCACIDQMVSTSLQRLCSAQAAACQGVCLRTAFRHRREHQACRQGWHGNVCM